MMEFLKTFFKYFLNNWRWIVPVILQFIALLIVIFRRKVKINDVLSSVFLKIPDFINNAEAENLKGPEKFKMVFAACVSLVCSLTGQKKDFVLSQYGSILIDTIESILSTPQKKEIKK